MQNDFPYQIIVNDEENLIWANNRDQALIKAARLHPKAQDIHCERVDSSGNVIPAIIACNSAEGIVQNFSCNLLEDLPTNLVCLAFDEDDAGEEEEMVLFRQENDASKYVYVGEYPLLNQGERLEELLIDCRTTSKSYLDAM